MTNSRYMLHNDMKDFYSASGWGGWKSRLPLVKCVRRLPLCCGLGKNCVANYVKSTTVGYLTFLAVLDLQDTQLFPKTCCYSWIITYYQICVGETPWSEYANMWSSAFSEKDTISSNNSPKNCHLNSQSISSMVGRNVLNALDYSQNRIFANLYSSWCDRSVSVASYDPTGQ